MAEGKVLFYTVNVRGPEDRGLSQRPPAFGIFALKQMAFACASEQDLSGSGYLETFGHRFSGFNAFGATHTSSLSLRQRGIFPRSGRFKQSARFAVRISHRSTGLNFDTQDRPAKGRTPILKKNKGNTFKL